jgi:hypothetical protein
MGVVQFPVQERIDTALQQLVKRISDVLRQSGVTLRDFVKLVLPRGQWRQAYRSMARSAQKGVPSATTQKEAPSVASRMRDQALGASRMAQADPFPRATESAAREQHVHPTLTSALRNDSERPMKEFIAEKSIQAGLTSAAQPFFLSYQTAYQDACQAGVVDDLCARLTKLSNGGGTKDPAAQAEAARALLAQIRNRGNA